MLNKVTLIGNIASMETRTAANDTEYIKFTLAVKRLGTKKEEPITDFLFCTTFVPHIINLMHTYTKIGDRICVCGSLETSSVQNNKGELQTKIYVKTTEIVLLPNKRDDDVKTPNKVEPIDDDPLPF